MNLLFITQILDKEDDVLGFVHRWIEKFAQKFEFINVICLKQGQYSLPPNVRVWSLGKEAGKSRIEYIIRFYKHIWKLRKCYDAVFVHMNPVYMVLGGIFWKVWKKRVFLWHNHQLGNFITRLGIKLSDTAFYTSPFSFAAKFKKSKIMPAGIDTENFKFQISNFKIKNSILYLGRISPIKSVDILIEAVKFLDEEGINFVLNIVGEAGEKEKDYFEKVKNLAKELETKGKIKFLGKVPNYKTPEIYNQNEILANLSPSGLFDKTILEAMACQALVIVSSNVLKGTLPDFLMFKEKDAADLKNKIINAFNLSKTEKEELAKKFRNYVIKNHNLDNLIDKITSITYV